MEQFFYTHLCPARGHWIGVTVWVLSWIYKLGECFMSFSPPLQPLTPSTASPSFHSRLHNHCTAHKGLSSQVQPRLARIKERFQHKMFFPHFFKLLLPFSFLFSLFFSCHPVFFPFTPTSALLAHFFHFLPNIFCYLWN